MNMLNTYISLYFPKINNEKLVSIFNFLRDKEGDEVTKVIDLHRVVQNDIFIENEPIQILEKIRDEYEIEDSISCDGFSSIKRS